MPVPARFGEIRCKKTALAPLNSQLKNQLVILIKNEKKNPRYEHRPLGSIKIPGHCFYHALLAYLSQWQMNTHL